MKTRNPDLGWVQASDALAPVLKRLADKMGDAERAHPCALRSGSAERDAVMHGVGVDRARAGNAGAK